MQFDSVSTFFAMGGYGFFVWLAYGFTATVLILLVLSSIRSHKNIKRQIIQRQKREQKLRQAAQQQEQQAQQAQQATEQDESRTNVQANSQTKDSDPKEVLS